MTDTPPSTSSRFKPVDKACEHAGLGRSSIYEMAGTWPGLMRKYGRRSLIDMQMLDQILDALPVAGIKAPK